MQYDFGRYAFGLLSINNMVSFSARGFILLSFVIGSLLAIIYSDAESIIDYFKTLLEQYKNYILGTITIVFFTVFVSFMTGQDGSLKARWETSFIGIIKGILSNILGIPSLFNTKWVASGSGTWEYLGALVVMLIIAPLICFLAKRSVIGIVVVLIPCFFPNIIGAVGNGSQINKYYSIFVIAIIFETRKIWDKFRNYIDQHILKKIVSVIINICVIVLCLLISNNYNNIGYLFHCVAILSFSCITITIINGTVNLKKKDITLVESAVYFCAISVPVCRILFRKYIYGINLFKTYSTALLIMSVIFVIFSLVFYYGPYIICKINTREKSFEILSSICLVVINLVIVFSIATPTYLTNDDASIANALSGNTLGEIYPYHIFVNYCLSYPISFLYGIFPHIPWWYAISILAIALGMFAIHYTYVRLANENHFSVWVAIAVAEVFDIALVWSLIQAVSFTIIPAMLGCFSIMILLTLQDITKPFFRTVLIVLFGINTLWAVWHRQESGLIVICFYFVIFAFLFFKTNDNLWGYLKKAIPIITVFILVILSIEINHIEKDKVSGKDFKDFNHYRSMFLDYPHDTYSENPELYDKVGWNENTYTLMNSWNFMDDNITTEKLKYITEHSNKKSQNVINKTIQGVLEKPSCNFLLLIWLCSVIVWILYIIINIKRECLIAGVLNNIGAGLLILYQILTGRILYRSMAAVIIPAVFINTILIFYSYKKKTTILSIILITLLGTMGIYSITQNVNSKYWKSLDKLAKIDTTVCQYLEKHSENTYISSVGVLTNIDPFNDYSKSNMISVGGSEAYSDSYYRKLHRNGLEFLNGDAFKKSNVFFISKTNVKELTDLEEGSYFNAFFQELKKQYGISGFEQVDKITDSIFVYRFYTD